MRRPALGGYKKMPPAVSAAEGIRRVNPPRPVRSITLSTECTDVQAYAHRSTPEPWQSWGSTARYLIVRISQAVPSGLLVWLAYVRH